MWRPESRNFLCSPQHLFPPFSILLCSPIRQVTSSSLRVGGRKSPLGFSTPAGKAPQVKQGRPMGVVKRIPGTTRVEYTNKKGRSFSFRIPITELTHPPVRHPSYMNGTWREIDTSFCDTGELEGCMPSPVEDYLRQRVERASVFPFSSVHNLSEGKSTHMEQEGKETDDGVFQFPLTINEIREVGRLFKEYCKNYVLLDTNGMKSSMSYNELNTGPDYEHYDRKLMRKRYWLSIRQTYKLVTEIIWPSEVLEEETIMAEGEEEDKEKDEKGIPKKMIDQSLREKELVILTPEEMLDILVWLEAASTFCVRSWRTYDYYSKDWFTPLNLSREVQVVAKCVKENPLQFFFSSTKGPKGGADKDGLASFQHGSDRLVTCIGLCQAHGVSLSCFFPSSKSSALVSSLFPHSGLSTSFSSPSCLLTHIVSQLPSAAHQFTPKDAIRILHGICSGCTRPIDYDFSSTLTINVNNERTGCNNTLLLGLSKLCAVFTERGIEALENVDENELCIMLQFIVHIKEGNRSFLMAPSGEERNNYNNLKENMTTHMGEKHRKESLSLQELSISSSTLEECRKTILRFEELCLARCRYLLYRLGGPQTVVLSGDNPFIPLIDFQKHKENVFASPSRHSSGNLALGSTTQTLLHYRIGKEHAQGLRRVSLQSKSVEVLTFISRLQSINAAGSTRGRHSSLEESSSQQPNETEVEDRVTELAEDIIQHIALRTSSSLHSLTLSELVRLLPILARVALIRQKREDGLFLELHELERDHERSSGSSGGIHRRYHRLLHNISTAIGLEMQRVSSSSPARQGEMIVELVEGLGQCKFIPATLPSVEMVLIRHCLQGSLSLSEVKRALMGWLALRGPLGVSPALLHAAGSLVSEYLERREMGLRPSSFTPSAGSLRCEVEHSSKIKQENWVSEDAEATEMLDLLRVISYCPYPSITGLVIRIAEMNEIQRSTKEVTSSTHCVLGILFTFAALSSSSIEGEKNDKLFHLASRELRAGVAALPHFHHTDVVIDTLLSFAALNEPLHLSHSLELFLSQLSALHTVLTPTHAVSVLEALEILKLHHIATTLYTRYAEWLVEYFQPMLSQRKNNGLEGKTSSRSVSPASMPIELSSSDRAAVLLLSQLQHLTPKLKGAIISLLQHDILNLEMERDRRERSNLSSFTSSFESLALKKKEALRVVEEDMVRVCSALYQLNGKKLSL